MTIGCNSRRHKSDVGDCMHNRLGSYSRYRHKVGCSGGTGDLRCLHDRAGTFASSME